MADHTGIDQFIESVSSGNVDAVQDILKGENSSSILNQQNGEGRSIFHAAAISGQNEILTLLLESDANPNLQDAFLQTPLILAAEKGVAHTETVELLSASSKVELNLQDSFGRTAAHWAARRGAARALAALLLREGGGGGGEEGGGPDAARTASGETALHWACQPDPDGAPPAGKLECAQMLLEKGADPLLCNNAGEAALDKVDPENEEMKTMLQSRIELWKRDKERESLNHLSTNLNPTGEKGNESKAEIQHSVPPAKVASSARPGLGGRGNFSMIGAAKKKPKMKITLKK